MKRSECFESKVWWSLPSCRFRTRFDGINGSESSFLFLPVKHQVIERLVAGHMLAHQDHTLKFADGEAPESIEHWVQSQA